MWSISSNIEGSKTYSSTSTNNYKTNCGNTNIDFSKRNSENILNQLKNSTNLQGNFSNNTIIINQQNNNSFEQQLSLLSSEFSPLNKISRSLCPTNQKIKDGTKQYFIVNRESSGLYKQDISIQQMEKIDNRLNELQLQILNLFLTQLKKQYSINLVKKEKIKEKFFKEAQTKKLQQIWKDLVLNFETI